MGQKTKSGKMPALRGKKKKFYDALMTSRDQFTQQINFHSSEALVNNANAGEAGMSTHMADLGSDNARHDMELAMITNEGDTLDLIDEAIERLISGSYGACLDCSAKITDDRLEAKPYRATPWDSCPRLRRASGPAPQSAPCSAPRPPTSSGRCRSDAALC